MLNKEVLLNLCVFGKDVVVKLVVEIIGKSVEKVELRIVYIKCKGVIGKVKLSYNYKGIEDCVVVILF